LTQVSLNYISKLSVDRVKTFNLLQEGVISPFALALFEALPVRRLRHSSRGPGSLLPDFLKHYCTSPEPSTTHST